MVVSHAKFGQVLIMFCLFQILKFWKQEIGLDAQRHRRCSFPWSTFWRKGLYIWIQHDESITPRKFQQFWRKTRSPKGQKNYQTMTSLPLFGHREAALGDFTFEGAHDLQMKMLNMFQKLDRKTFTMSYLGLDLANGKASKTGCESVLCFWLMALRFWLVCQKSNFCLLSLQVDFVSLHGWFYDCN